MNEEQSVRDRALSHALTYRGDDNIKSILNHAEIFRNYITDGLVEPPAKVFHLPSNIVDFAKSCKIAHAQRGVIEFSPHPYQKNLLEDFVTHSNIFSIIGRQMGGSTLAQIMSVWECLSKPNIIVMIILTSHNQRKDFIRCLNGLGIGIDFSQNTIFTNGSKLLIKTISEVDFSCVEPNLIFLIDAAFMSIRYLNLIWDTINTISTRVYVITSLNRRPSIERDAFMEMFSDNRFHKTTTPSRLHPDRDEAWAVDMIATIGKDAYDMEYECEFTT